MISGNKDSVNLTPVTPILAIYWMLVCDWTNVDDSVVAAVVWGNQTSLKFKSSCCCHDFIRHFSLWYHGIDHQTRLSTVHCSAWKCQFCNILILLRQSGSDLFSQKSTSWNFNSQFSLFSDIFNLRLCCDCSWLLSKNYVFNIQIVIGSQYPWFIIL